MNLAEFVELTMKEKGLNRSDVERNSGEQVTDTTIGAILAGEAKNPTLRILLALAKGLDVHPVEVFKAAAEVEEPEELASKELARMVQRIVDLEPGEIKQLRKLLKID